MDKKWINNPGLDLKSKRFKVFKCSQLILMSSDLGLELRSIRLSTLKVYLLIRTRVSAMHQTQSRKFDFIDFKVLENEGRSRND